jgi:hypothetical protein
VAARAAVCAWAVFLLVQPAAAYAKATLKPMNAAPLVFTFGLSRTAQTRNIFFKVTGTHSTDNPITAVATDLEAEKSAKPASSIPKSKRRHASPKPKSRHASLQPKSRHAFAAARAPGFIPAAAVTVSEVATNDPTLVAVTVKVDPADAKHGSYHGSIYLVAKDIARVRLPLTATLSQRGYNSIWFAALAIFVGIAVAAALKWLTGAAATTRTLLHRYRDLARQLDLLHEWAPPNALGELEQARRRIAAGDLDTATTTLDQFTPKLSAYAPLLAALQALGHALDQQTARLKSPPIPAADLRALSDAAAALKQHASDLLNALWEQPADPSQNPLTDNIQIFAEVISAIEDPDRRAAAEALLPELASENWRGLQAGIPPVAAPAPPATVAPGLGAPLALIAPLGALGSQLTQAVLARAAAATSTIPGGTGRAWRWVRGFVLENSGFFAGCIIAAVTTTIGLESLYSGTDTFGSWQDWLKLAGWGFGAQITGITVAQLGNHFSSSGPSI